MVMRFDPFRDIDRLTEQMVGAGGRQQVPSVLPMDAFRRGDQFTVHFDLPGADADSIELTVERNVLTVRAERRWRREEGDEVLAAERPQGTFSRQLFLGESLDPDRIEASYEQGVLTLHIPVAEQAKPRRVTIAGGGQQATTVEATSTLS